MRLQLQNKINELVQLRNAQWEKLQTAKMELCAAEESDPIRQLRDRVSHLRSDWCKSASEVDGLELALQHLDGFGASDADPSQPIGIESK